MKEVDPPSGWGVFNGSRLYFPRTYPKKKDANKALLELVDIYPADSEWRRKLTVDFYVSRKERRAACPTKKKEWTSMASTKESKTPSTSTPQPDAPSVAPPQTSSSSTEVS